MKILVAYETGHGSTEETAEVIAEVMREAGSEAEVTRCRKVEDVSGYDAVIVGAPIWYEKWLAPAAKFLKQNAEALCRRPTALFLTSGTASDDKGKQSAEKYVAKVPRLVPELEPVSVGNFGGVYNFPKYSIPMRAMIAAICKVRGLPTSGVHDYRDWDDIKAWAAEVHKLLAEKLGQ